MEGQLACPFCHERWSVGQLTSCPECGVDLAPAEPVPRPAASGGEPEWTDPPELRPLPWTFWRRGRGALLGVAALGIASFFTPWLSESAPELRTLSGFDLARLLPWMWAPCVAWFVMLPLVASRRSLRALRGARVAVGFLAAIALVTAIVRGAVLPEASRLRPVRVELAWGLYLGAAVGLVGIALATRLGGRQGDLSHTPWAPHGARRESESTPPGA